MMRKMTETQNLLDEEEEDQPETKYRYYGRRRYVYRYHG